MEKMINAPCYGRLASQWCIVKNPSANSGGTRAVGLIPGWGRSHGEGDGSPLQHPCLENPQEEPGELQSVGNPIKVIGVVRPSERFNLGEKFYKMI